MLKKLTGILLMAVFIVIASYSAVYAMAGSIVPLACGGVAIVAFGVVVAIIKGNDPNKAKKIAKTMKDLQD